MFNRKKKEIEYLEERLKAKQAEMRDLMKANGELKRTLAALQAEYDTLEKLYQPLSCKNQGLREENIRLKHTIETQQNEMHTMYEKMSAAAEQQNACPADCVRHQNPGPGGSVCRNCKRNPNAKDKYISTETEDTSNV